MYLAEKIFVVKIFLELKSQKVMNLSILTKKENA